MCSILLFYSSSIFATSTVTATSPAALRNVLALRPEMIATLSEQQRLYQQKLLQNHPVIVALFSSTGGQFILYRPNHAPLVAPSLPNAQDYQLAAIVEHTAMSAYLLAIQEINNPVKSASWQNQMKSYQTKIALAENSINALDILPTEKELFHSILRQTNAFITENLRQGTISSAQTNTFAQTLKPYFVQLSKIVIGNQVTHWMQVTEDWKQLLGNNWQKAYGVVMYINTKPKNNIFLDILIHYMGQDAVGQRLFYFTADSYSPTAVQALDLLTNATPDKALATKLFGEYFLLYSQILGQTARGVIAQKAHLT